MALTGNTVQSTYLDLVQLEQSGAGLPSHAGKEAALYDGSGAQIVGRTAVRHWLDPHPDAAALADTWEFSATGDMTQGELETAGWTFSNCTAEVARGVLLITATSTAVVKAYYTVNLTGDFDIEIGCSQPFGYNKTVSGYTLGGGGVADTVNNVAHYALCRNSVGNPEIATYKSGAFTTLAGTQTIDGPDTYANVSRVMRSSGTVYLSGGPNWPLTSLYYGSNYSLGGFDGGSSVADADTYQAVFVTGSNGNCDSGRTFGIFYIRRFQ